MVFSMLYGAETLIIGFRLHSSRSLFLNLEYEEKSVCAKVYFGLSTIEDFEEVRPIDVALAILCLCFSLFWE